MNYNVVRESLINYEVYDNTDGTADLMGTSSIDLPDVEYMTQDIKGAGILGELSVPILGHTSDLTCTLHWRTIHNDLTKLSAPRAHILDLRGAIQNYDAGTGLLAVSPVVIVFRGLPHKRTLGKFEPGELTDSENEFGIDYLKITVDDEEVIEFDKLNYIFRVNGTDYMSDVKTAVGR